MDPEFSNWQRNIFAKRRRKGSDDALSDSQSGKLTNFCAIGLGSQMTLDSLKFIINNKNCLQQQQKAGCLANKSDNNYENCATPLKPAAELQSHLSTAPPSKSSVRSPNKSECGGFKSAAELAGIPVCQEKNSGAQNSGKMHSGLAGRKEDVQTKSNPNVSSWQQKILDNNKDLTPEHIQRVLVTLIPRESNEVRSDDIGGLSTVKQIIQNRIIRPLQRPELHQGLYKASSGVLLFGPPGTGKTTLAKWIASEAKASFFCVTPSTLISMYMGETESLVKCLFLCAASLAPSIIFLDEIDGFIGKRSQKEEETTIRMKNELLQAMDGLKTSSATIIVIGATNRPDALDDAALRRLPKRIHIPLPDSQSIFAQMHRILLRHARETEMCLCGDLQNHQCGLKHYDFNILQKDIMPLIRGFNGSDIQALCVKAAELVYQRTLRLYNNDIYQVPAASKFGLPAIEDFKEALKFCHPSVNSDQEDLHKWEQSYGCG